MNVYTSTKHVEPHKSLALPLVMSRGTCDISRGPAPLCVTWVPHGLAMVIRGRPWVCRVLPACTPIDD
jgi:hypothetical protein